MDLVKIREDLKPMAEALGLKLYNLEYVKEDGTNILRVTVDKLESVTIDDVSNLTEKVNDYLDKTDPIDESYSLEVTSRGIEKEFTIDEAKDYLNEYVFVKTMNQELYGTLLEAENGYFIVRDQRNKKIKINTNDIVLIRTAVKI